ncbi:MAG TPA: alanyl-tRNA editing protein, partial [Thermomicrobiales bacterium]|nr:alanyl-tRNA editing protein [Thermomicrobiales bacterium]
MTDLQPTDLLFQRDAYLRAFDADIVAVDPETRGVALDRTAFYATGGGQPADEGVLRVGDRQWPVAGARKAGGVVWHALGGEEPLPAVGERAHGEIDWDRRYALMRTHTALHVLCGVVFRDYGALVTGGNMGPAGARMDFEMDSSDFTPERVAAIERRANEEIGKDHPIRVQILPREDAFQIPDLIRTKINLLPPGIPEVRTVEIV